MLKTKTIVKAFEKRGWTEMHIGAQGEKSKVWLISPDRDTHRRIFAEIEGNYIKLSDARHKENPNVQIVSFWSPFTMKELKENLDRIEKVYSELCGTQFERRYDESGNL